MTPPLVAPLTLVVTRGVDVGAHLRVGTERLIVGRADTTDLVLTDPCISRRHLIVERRPEGMRLQVCEGAEAMVVGDTPVTQVTLPVGGHFAVGKTVFSVVDEPRPTSVPPDNDAREEPDVRTVASGAAPDVRGRTAIVALSRALLGATEASAVENVVAAWASRHADAANTAIRFEADIGDARELAYLRARSTEEVFTPPTGSAGARLVVPAHAAALAWITFEFPREREHVSPAAYDLLCIGGQLAASRLAHLQALEAAAIERQELRELAVGSARAFLGASPEADRVRKLITRVAPSDSTILLLGESGVGKSFIGRLIHEESPRAKAPYRVINCAAIPENLIEAELFGHEKGAFTGATTARAGAFEAAGDGTVLLDEIGELPLAMQAKLLRVIEERKCERIGSNRALPINARVLAATNRNLREMVSQGHFRHDLFFRVSVVDLEVAPLRRRMEDLELIVKQLLQDLARVSDRRVAGLTPSALELLRSYSWPGNVRELRNALEHAIVVGDGPLLGVSELPPWLRTIAPPPNDSDTVKLPANADWLRRKNIDVAMREGRSKKRAAALIGMSRTTFARALERKDSDDEA